MNNKKNEKEKDGQKNKKQLKNRKKNTFVRQNRSNCKMKNYLKALKFSIHIFLKENM